MEVIGEDLASKLRRVLQQHQVQLEPAATFYPERRWSPDSNDPTLAYLSQVLLEDDDRVDEVVHQKSYQGLLDELTAIVSPSSSSDSGSLGSPSYEGVSSPELEERFGTVDIHSYLMECARAVAVKDGLRFYNLARELKQAVSSQATPLERTALFFIEALIARITGTGPQACRALGAGIGSRRILAAASRLWCMPCAKAPQIFANDLILRACAGARRVHIVDYGICRGQQWPSLIKSLAVRPGGPPQLKITGVETPLEAEATHAGRFLIDYARSVGVHLDYSLIQSSSWEVVQPQLHVSECLIVNSCGGLRHVKDEWVAVNNPRRLLFERIYRMKPKLVTLGVMNANTSSPFFMPKFEEALRQATAKMEYMEAWLGDSSEELSFKEKMSEKLIMNMVACDGLEQTERPEKYKSWDAKVRRAGFKPVSPDEELYDRVRTTWGGLKYSDNFRCGRDENWVLLGWKDAILVAMSAWQSKSGF